MVGILLLSVMAITGAFVACSGQNAAQTVVRFTVDSDSDVAVRDLRFYLHDLALLTGDGRAHEVKLATTPPWQSARLALIDLVGASALDRNDTVRGTVVDGIGQFVGVRFSVGVPFELNHVNPLTAAAPLNRADMFWAWQTGYKFLRVDLADKSGAQQGREWSFHLGSTGCSSASALRPPSQPCKQPNIMRIELRGFDPLRQPVNLKLDVLLHAMRSTSYNVCTGDYAHDPACLAAYASTGLDVATGQCRDGACTAQRLFGAE